MAWLLFDVRRDFWPVVGGAFEEGTLTFFQILVWIRPCDPHSFRKLREMNGAPSGLVIFLIEKLRSPVG